MEFNVALCISVCSFILFVDGCHGRLLYMANDSSFIGFDPTRVTQLSWSPRAFLYKDFLSEYECDHLIDLAKNKLQQSMVVDDEIGSNVASSARTSYGMFLDNPQRDEIVSRIEQRIATWTFIPIENGESIQVLRYEVGQEYKPHVDYFNDKVSQVKGGHRIATVLMYLSNVQKGGETVFPYGNLDVEQPKDDTWSECAKKGYAVKASKGDALLFFSLHPNATVDRRSLHGSCPVIEGEKWSATKWIHVSRFGRRPIPGGPCIDEDPNCPEWAMAGECLQNPRYMIGNTQMDGYCRKSCKAC